MKRLSIFFATLTLNVALLWAAAFWLAGQFSMIEGWAAIGGTGHLVHIDREGWLWHRMPGGIFQLLGRGTQIGVATHDYLIHGNKGGWEEHLSDGNVAHPLPGVLRYSDPVGGASWVQIIGVRHWLIFLLTFGVWCGWRTTLRRFCDRRDDVD